MERHILSDSVDRPSRPMSGRPWRHAVRRSFLVAWTLLLAATTLMLIERPAAAHEVGLSRSLVREDAHELVLELGVAATDLASAVPGHHAGEALSEETQRQLLSLLHLSRGTVACTLTPVSAVPDSADGISLTAHAEGCGGSEQLSLDAALLISAAGARHRHHARIVSRNGDQREALLIAGDAALRGAEAEAAPGRPAKSVAVQYFLLGIEHILFGIDHVVFLLALLLTAKRVRELAFMVTAFTVSHSITLAVAVLGIWAPSPSWVEPLIALSVAYVGVENFVIKDAGKRWRLAAFFGLIHGFGFAGALGEIGVPASQVPIALFAFNGGVELGQLALLSVTYPLLSFLRRREWISRRFVLGASAAVAVAGLFWFVTRVAPLF